LTDVKTELLLAANTKTLSAHFMEDSMKEKLLISLFLSAFLALFSFIACSDSDDDGNGTGPIPQTTLEDQVQQDINLILSSILQGFSNWDGFEPPSSDDAFGKRIATTEPMDTSQGYANGWHYFIMNGSATETDQYGTYSYTVSLADSVQFKEDGLPVPTPSEETDYLRFIMHMTLNMDISQEFEQENINLSVDFDEYYIDFEYQEQASQDIEVDGNFDYEYSLSGSSSEGVVTGDISYDLSVSNLLLDADDGCPKSGTISANASLDVSSPEGSGSGSWSLTITFTGPTSISVHAESGGNSYDWVDTYFCEGVSASRKSFIPPIVTDMLE
jgi:hypothetical protein